jgi:hypothetical protein
MPKKEAMESWEKFKLPKRHRNPPTVAASNQKQIGAPQTHADAPPSPIAPRQLQKTHQNQQPLSPPRTRPSSPQNRPIQSIHFRTPTPTDRPRTGIKGTRSTDGETKKKRNEGKGEIFTVG